MKARWPEKTSERGEERGGKGRKREIKREVEVVEKDREGFEHFM